MGIPQCVSNTFTEREIAYGLFVNPFRLSAGRFTERSHPFEMGDVLC